MQRASPVPVHRATQLLEIRARASPDPRGTPVRVELATGRAGGPREPRV